MDNVVFVFLFFGCEKIEFGILIYECFKIEVDGNSG